MDIDDFMDINKPVKRIVLTTNQLQMEQTFKDTTITVKEHQGDGYAIELKEEQEKKMRRMFMNQNLGGAASTISDIDFDESFEESKANLTQELLKKYKSTKPSSNLPVHQYEDEILETIKNNPVVIIKGETGSGKSTQVPQMILDDSFSSQTYCNILVTQPRRIAAISLATHVSRERGCMLGSLVGYQIGLEKDVTEDTRLLYCTTGVALQKLVKMKSMSSFTHIILDEVHERDEEMEFLLILVKIFLIENSPNTKLILMSATFDTEEFSRYFRTPGGGSMIDAPTINLTAERQFKIREFFLEDLESIAQKAVFDYDTPGIDASVYNVAVILIAMFYNWNKDDHKSEDCPTVLVFLPGIHEIQELFRKLKSIENSDMKLQIIPLHSSVSSVSQKDVFKKPAKGYLKVILSTNIAESSITVPDVAYVIDFCLTRSLEADNSTGFATLKLNWASKNSCKQRAGRTGRTRNGRVYRLISRGFYENEFPEADKPALKRCALEKIVLKTKMLDIGLPPFKILGLAINPPDKTSIDNAIMLLKETRGLHLYKNNVFLKDDGDITFLGRIMDALPLDVRATRLVVLGYIFSVFEECVIIAAGLTVQKIFHVDVKNPMKSFYQRLAFADGSGSDLFAIMHAYLFWLRRIHDNRYGEIDRQRAANVYSLDLKGLDEMHCLIHEIHNRLKHFHIVETEGHQQTKLSDREKNIILKVCIAGAFYPNYFLRKSVNSEDCERKIFHELNGRDPCSTIYYRGLEGHQLPLLYQDQIKRYLKDNNVVGSASDVKVSVDEGASKIYVTFEGKQDIVERPLVGEPNSSAWLPGKVKIEVFKALKLSRENKRLKLCILLEKDFAEYKEEIEQNQKYQNFDDALVDLCVLPGDPLVESVIGTVCSVTNPNDFWFRPYLGNEKILTTMENKLNACPLYDLDPKKIEIGRLVAAKYSTKLDLLVSQRERFHRGRIVAMLKVFGESDQYKVFLIDEGIDIVVPLHKLKSLSGVKLAPQMLGLKRKRNEILITEIPPRIFKCSLAETQPSYLKSGHGKWTMEAVEKFQEECDVADVMKAKIYSVWNGVVNVILLDPQMQSINKKLINLQLAEKGEECYPSKQDHALRYRLQTFSKRREDESHKRIVSAEVKEYLKSFLERKLTPPPEKLLLGRQVILRGPFSPLETTIHALTRIGATNKSEVERFSINTVMLDTDPQEPSERLVVCCAVSTSARGLTLRSTTIMPPIQGLSGLIGTLFAPTLEMHRDPSKTRYSSVLCGLGASKGKNMSHFEEHDLSLSFDADLDTSDMQNINKVRYLMSALLHTLPGEEAPNITPDRVAILKRDIKQTLVNLLSRKRHSIDSRVSTDDFEWGKVNEKELLECSDVYKERATFPMFRFMKLQPETDADVQVFRNNNQELHAIAFAQASLPINQKLQCLLCSKLLENVPELQVHLFTKLHQDRAEQCQAIFQEQNYRRSKLHPNLQRSLANYAFNDSFDE